MTFRPTRILTRAPLFTLLLATLAPPLAAQTPPTAQFPIEPPKPPASAPSAAPTPAPPPAAPPPAAPPSAAPAPASPPPAPAAAPSPAPAPSAAPAPSTAPGRVEGPPPAPAATPLAPAPGTTIGLLGAPPPEDAVQLTPPAPTRAPIYFETSPGWAVELGVRGGLGTLAGSDARGAFAFGGGVLRGRYKYFQFGGFFDKSDDTDAGGGFTHFGGMAGAWLPYHNWVDFEVALAFGSRRYEDSDPRYGAGGYALAMPALSLIAGVSDRAQAGKVGGRVGGQIIATGDFAQKDRPWSFLQETSAGEVIETNGVTHVGGFSVSLVFYVALDYGEGP